MKGDAAVEQGEGVEADARHFFLREDEGVGIEPAAAAEHVALGQRHGLRQHEIWAGAVVAGKKDVPANRLARPQSGRRLEIAQALGNVAAQQFGQEDDITVLTLTRVAAGEERVSELTTPALSQA